MIFSEISETRRFPYFFFTEFKPMNVLPGEMMSLEYLDGRITVHPDICNGHPTIRGMRITVETVLGFLSAGDSPEEILRQYPSLEAADIDACLRFAADLMSRRYSLQGVA